MSKFSFAYGVDQRRRQLRVKYKIDELVSLVHPRNKTPKVLAMLEAYLDETGIHQGAKLCVIAGYFGGPGQWRKFEAKWLKALAASNIPLDQFHAMNLMKRHKYFYGWKDAEHHAALDRLSNAIASSNIHPVSVGLFVDDFLTLSTSQRRFLTGATVKGTELVSSGSPNSPYFMPFQACIKQVVSYAAVGGKVHFFFGLDRPAGKYASALYAIIKNGKQPDDTRRRLGDISFPLAKETPELQAADLLAYLTVMHMQGANKQQVNWPLSVLLANTRMREDHVYHDRETIKLLIDGLSEEAPQLAFEQEDEELIPIIGDTGDEP